VNLREGAGLASAATDNEAQRGLSTGKYETTKPLTNILQEPAGGAP
jgi:hypothetical protein